MNLKVTVEYNRYREHYMLFDGHVPDSLRELIQIMKSYMIRSLTAIEYEYGQAFTANGWKGRICWIDKDGDEILILDDTYLCFKDYMETKEMSTIVMHVPSINSRTADSFKKFSMEYKIPR